MSRYAYPSAPKPVLTPWPPASQHSTREARKTQERGSFAPAAYNSFTRLMVVFHHHARIHVLHIIATHATYRMLC